MTDDLQSEMRKAAREYADRMFPGNGPADSALRDGFVTGYLAHASIDDEPPVGTVLACSRNGGTADIVWRRPDQADDRVAWEISGVGGLVSWAVIRNEFPTRVMLVPKS